MYTQEKTRHIYTYISANDLNKDLSTIQKWAHQWKMEFNPDLTKQASEVLFSHKGQTGPPSSSIQWSGSEKI